MDRSASETLRLPPSPELIGVGIHAGGSVTSFADDHGSSIFDGLPESSVDDRRKKKRLQSMARYESYRPEALACSPPMASYGGLHSANSANAPLTSSLGAVAGSQGVVVFRMAQPHVPKMFLTHHAAAASTQSTCALTFQSTSLLASATHSSVLIWDVSGQSLSPLRGRLSALPDHDGADAQTIADLTWWSPTSLLTLSASIACCWDLRQRTPSLRFGSSKLQQPNVQIAVSDRDTTCSILDSGGLLRLFDVRMMGAARVGTLGECMAHAHAGIGLDYWSAQGAYVTWGLDGPEDHADGLVKIWARGDSSRSVASVAETSGVTDEYWFMDGSPDRARSVATKSAASGGPPCREIGRCSVGNLACARVCPGPIPNHFITVSLKPADQTSPSDWRADVWKLDLEMEKSVEHIVAFKGSAETESHSMVGSDVDKSSLRGAELAISSYESNVTADQKDFGVVLCALSDRGFVTTYAVPEATLAIEERNSKGQRSKDSMRFSNHRTTIPEQVPAMKLVPRVEGHNSVGDAAYSWIRRRDSIGASEISAPFMSTSVPLDDPLTGDGEVPLPHALSATVTSGLVSGEETQPEVKRFIPEIDKSQIPCPGICGARFSAGVGGLVGESTLSNAGSFLIYNAMAVFSNGNVKRTWSWWQRNRPLETFPGVESLKTENSLTSNYPRTLQDLVLMKEAGAEARWRSNDANTVDSSSGVPVDGSTFYESESDASSESADESGGFTPPDSSRFIYEATLAGQSYQRSLTEILGNQTDVALSDVDDDIGQLFPATDQAALSPTVFVSSANENKFVSNNQNAQLAELLEFGGVPGDDEESVAPSPLSSHRNGQFSDRGDTLSSPPRQRLPSYRSLLPTKGQGHADQAETGVRGGEYPVRPNAQESIIFLRKLFAHQQQDVSQSRNGESRAQPGTTAKPLDRGVQTIEAQRPTKAFSDDITKMEASCANNARVCEFAGETDKAKTWQLLKQTLAYQRLRIANDFDGWNSAIGSGIVDKVLRYYEARGDVQMLSSIVALLLSVDRSGKANLLQRDQYQRYNLYITRYVELLYGWNLLSLRAAYLKCLRFPYLKTQTRTISNTANDHTREATMEFVFKCPRCSTQHEEGINHCRTCQDFSFRCSLCDQAVRGLFIMCEICGHGGHVNHMKTWFEENETCPTGCGCNCRNSSQLQQREQAGPQIANEFVPY